MYFNGYNYPTISNIFIIVINIPLLSINIWHFHIFLEMEIHIYLSIKVGSTYKLVYNLQSELKEDIRIACNHHLHKKTPTSDPHTTSSHHDEINTDQTFWPHARRKASGRNSFHGANQSRRQHRQTIVSRNRLDNSGDHMDNESYPKRDIRCYQRNEINHTTRTCRHERPITCHQSVAEGQKARHHFND